MTLSAGAEEARMPIWPLLATLAVQTLATMALYSLPTLAPEVARLQAGEGRPLRSAHAPSSGRQPTGSAANASNSR